MITSSAGGKDKRRVHVFLDRLDVIDIGMEAAVVVAVLATVFSTFEVVVARRAFGVAVRPYPDVRSLPGPTILRLTGLTSTVS